nr:reverse transcriptase domain-containing protein [Tanacetum cinerariifolium]
MTNLHNEISNFQQRFDETFQEAWVRYKDLLRSCPHHGFTELHQLDTFYNALNPADQDSLNSAAGGNLLERRTRDMLTIIKNKSKQTSVVTTDVTSIFKQFQATPPPASVKAVKEVCVTCGGVHMYYQYLVVDGNTFLEFQDNIQGYVLASAVNYNQGSRPLPSNTIANPKGELKAITTRSGLVLDGPSVPVPPPFINLEEDKRVEETLMDPELESINMINIYDDSCEDFLEDLFATNHLSGNPTFSSHTDLTSLKVKDDIFDPEGDIVLIEKFLNLDFTKDVPPPLNINPLNDSTTSSSNHLLEEFIDELALITFPPRNDDLPFDIESDLREIEYLLNHDPTKEMDSILEDSVDEDNLTNPNVKLFDNIPEMFTDEHTLDCSSPPLYDEYDDDLFELESSDFLPSLEYDSFLFEDFSEVDALPSTENEDKVFNSGILIHENLSKVTVQVTPDKNVKKISSSHASLILKDFDPPLYELSFHKEVPWSETLLSFLSENEEKVFKPRILTSKGVHTFLLPELSHRGPKAFKVIKIFESPMAIFSLLLWRGHPYLGCSVSPFLSPMNNSIHGLGQAK